MMHPKADFGSDPIANVAGPAEVDPIESAEADAVAVADGWDAVADADADADEDVSADVGAAATHDARESQHQRCARVSMPWHGRRSVMHLPLLPEWLACCGPRVGVRSKLDHR